MNIRSNFSRIALITLSVIGVVSAASAHPPWERDYRRYDDEFARVVNVEPIVHRERVSTPDRECWSEDRPVYSNPSGTEIRSTIIGGLIGAAVGHHIGREIHDPAAVIGGSLIGAAIGN
ncbi:MAG TPA: glycine zipper 2TM domain-containing protein, partial [Steroidobacteraceae bacterium]|nr:glycine zipper 2TM domain-containing protein [Steroidobacteraceae bacterium]